MVKDRRGEVTVSPEMLWTLLRALGLAVAALAIGTPVARGLAGLRGAQRTSAWALLLAPALTPSIVVGYALMRGMLAGGVRAEWHEVLYLAVLLARLTPVAVVLLALVPAPASPEGLHCFRLLAPHPRSRELRFHFHALGRGPAMALTLVFLLAFTEFELATLLNVRTWTVALFDAHAGGLALAGSLRLAVVPAAVEALALGALCWALRGTASALALHSEKAEKPMNAGVAAYLGLAALGVTALPILRILSQAGPGLAALRDTFAFGTDLVASATFALGASGAAWFLARPFPPRLVRVALGLTGLLGALTLSLLVLALFQLPGLHLAYDTPLPLLLTLTLLLLPLALLLRWMVEAMGPRNAVFIAAQLGQRRLLWELEGRRRFAAWALLFCWAFFDFTAASILAPLGFSPVFVRLHNLMHYGQTAVLSAMVCAAFTTPVAVLLLTGAVARFYARGHGR